MSAPALIRRSRNVASSCASCYVRTASDTAMPYSSGSRATDKKSACLSRLTRSITSYCKVNACRTRGRHRSGPTGRRLGRASAIPIDCWRLSVGAPVVSFDDQLPEGCRECRRQTAAVPVRRLHADTVGGGGSLRSPDICGFQGRRLTDTLSVRRPAVNLLGCFVRLRARPVEVPGGNITVQVIVAFQLAIRSHCVLGDCPVAHRLQG